MCLANKKVIKVTKEIPSVLAACYRQSIAD